MKRLHLIFGLILISFGCKAQLIPVPEGTVPLENYWSYAEAHGIPEGTYFKDVHHVLDKYVGSWEGNYNGKTYLITIDTLMNQTTDPRPSVRFDETRMRYKITDASGNVQVNTLNASNDEAFRGRIFDKNNNLNEIVYIGEDDEKSNCGDGGVLFIGLSDNNTKMHIYVEQFEHIYLEDDCPNGRFNPPFPQKDEPPMTLTKQ